MNTGHVKQPIPLAMYSGKVGWNPDIQNELGDIDWNTDWVKYFFWIQKWILCQERTGCITQWHLMFWQQS